MRETNALALKKLASETELAIYSRLQKLAVQRHPSAELKELRKAARELHKIRIAKLGWPDDVTRKLDISSGDPKKSPIGWRR